MRTISVIAFGVALSSVVSLVAAQGVDTGSLRGRVTDSTGAPLPGVSVAAVSEA